MPDILKLETETDRLWATMVSGTIETTEDLEDNPSDFALIVRILADAEEGIRRDFGTFEKRLREIENDSNLSDTGRKAKRVEIARSLLENLDTRLAKRSDGDVLSDARTMIEELSAELRVRPADTAGRAVREAEVREILRKNDALTNGTVLADAVDNGDELVYLAFVNAPAFELRNETLVTKLALTAAIHSWESKSDPEKAAQVRALRNAVDVVEQAVRGFTGHVSERAGLSPDSSILRVGA